ncbi:ORF174 [White spot syndrome virus]|uniref:ORF174 n=1 Tax=White spot syndrome virus TaxID=342409 RepID=A0A2D3I6W4_9VIRU|nr:ORF174 [White spot syndrome virus]
MLSFLELESIIVLSPVVSLIYTICSSSTSQYLKKINWAMLVPFLIGTLFSALWLRRITFNSPL